MITINPYLVFKDNCEEAFNFYQTVFDGEILFMGRYKDVPQESRRFFPDSADEKIMHATIRIDKDTILMGNDSVEKYISGDGTAMNNFYLYVSMTDMDEAYRVFNRLSDRGKVVMPIAPTFWSTHYGILTDRFGIQWKVTFDPGVK